jgi:hypothetical protein
MPIIPSGNRIIVKEFMKSYRHINWDYNALFYTAMECRKIAYKKGVHYKKLEKYKELFVNIETSITTLNFNTIVNELINFIKYHNNKKSIKKEFGEVEIDRDLIRYTFRVNYSDSTYKLNKSVDTRDPKRIEHLVNFLSVFRLSDSYIKEDKVY